MVSSKPKTHTTHSSSQQKSGLNVWSFLYLLFIPALPLIYSNQLVDPVLIPRQFALTVFVALISGAILLQLYSKKLNPDFGFLRSPLPIAMGLFLITTAVSLAQANVVSEGLYTLSKSLIAVLFFITTTYLLIQQKITVNQLVKSIFFCILITILIGSYQFIASNGNGIVVKSTMANKNLLSSLLFLSLPFVCMATFFSKTWKIGASLLMVLILLLLWVVQTKAALLASAAFFGILLISRFVIYRKVGRNKRFSKLIVLIAVSLTLIATVFTFQNKQVFRHLFNTKTLHTRIALWENSGKIIEDHFFLGVGAGNWKIHFPKHGLDSFNEQVQNGITNYQRPHNDFLWVLTEQGLLGFVTFLSLFILVVYYLVRAIRHTSNWNDKFTSIALFAGVIGYTLISFVDYPLERIEHQVFLYVIFSIATAQFYQNFQANKTTSKVALFNPILLLGVGSIVVFSFVVCTHRYSGEYHSSKLYAAQQKGNFSKMVKLADAATNSFYVIDPMSIPIQWYKGVALFSLNDTQNAKAAFEEARNLTPHNFHVLNNLASCYESLGAHSEAEKTYLMALSISPQFEESLLNLSAVYFNSGQHEKAFKTIDQCNINSTDSKYTTFLPPILGAKIDLIVAGITDTKLATRITNLKETENRLLQLYFDAKKANLDFETHLRNMASKEPETP